MPRVLLVEDEPLLREAYEMILKSGGLDVDTAEDGMKALEYYQKHSYDLVLLDLMMPQMDGAGFLRAADPKKNTPSTAIIIFSNLSSGADLDEALRLGGDRHLLKSDLSAQELIDEVKDVMSSKQKTD